MHTSVLKTADLLMPVSMKYCRHFSALSLSHRLTLLLILNAICYATAQSESPPPLSLQSGEQFSSVPKLNSVIAIITIASLIGFISTGIYSIYIHRSTENRIQLSAATLISLSGGEVCTAARGLDVQIIQAFPTILFSSVKDIEIGNGSLECAVCLNEFKDEETLRKLPKCCHVFHPDCIDAWLKSHTTCPVCRVSLIPKPEESESTDIQILEPDRNSGQANSETQ